VFHDGAASPAVYALYAIVGGEHAFHITATNANHHNWFLVGLWGLHNRVVSSWDMSLSSNSVNAAC